MCTIEVRFNILLMFLLKLLLPCCRQLKWTLKRTHEIVILSLFFQLNIYFFISLSLIICWFFFFKFVTIVFGFDNYVKAYPVICPKSGYYSWTKWTSCIHAWSRVTNLKVIIINIIKEGYLITSNKIIVLIQVFIKVNLIKKTT